jgi:hypothetical protein
MAAVALHPGSGEHDAPGDQPCQCWNSRRGIVTLIGVGSLGECGRDWQHEVANRPPLPPSWRQDQMQFVQRLHLLQRAPPSKSDTRAGNSRSSLLESRSEQRDIVTYNSGGPSGAYTPIHNKVMSGWVIAAQTLAGGALIQRTKVRLGKRSVMTCHSFQRGRSVDRGQLTRSVRSG